MKYYQVLDIDNVARIGLMFLDGDKLENVLVDRYNYDITDISYHHNAFNDLKISLLNLELINPDLKLTAMLWQLRPDNRTLAEPIIAGSAYTEEGWRITDANSEIRSAFEKGIPFVKKRCSGATSHYYPVTNSNNTVIGILELLFGQKQRNDI